jgi:hypothetical protein
VRRAVPLVLLALVLAGCTSSSDVPAEEDFAAGTCRTAAPDVRAVGESIPRLGDDGDVADEVKDELREAQDRLAALADGAEPSLQSALQELVVAIGIVRIRADGNTYEPAQGEALTRAYEQVLEVCVADGASR